MNTWPEAKLKNKTNPRQKLDNYKQSKDMKMVKYPAAFVTFSDRFFNPISILKMEILDIQHQ